MNKFDGIETVESCCGHNKTSYRIYFLARDLECLPRLLYWFDTCHTGIRGWRVIVYTDCSMCPVHFCLEGTIGEQSYIESKEIANKMEEYLKNENN
jgi:hypothetical protein